MQAAFVWVSPGQAFSSARTAASASEAWSSMVARSQLEQSLEEAYEAANPSRAAVQIVRGGINAFGPACESWTATSSHRLLQTLADTGFREITWNELLNWRT
jgi:hypothetical protein